MSNEDPQQESGNYDELVFRRELDEIYLLLDFVSGHTVKTLADLKDIQSPKDPHCTLKGCDEVLRELWTIRYPPQGRVKIQADSAAFLFAVRDKLNQIARPASGLTVAFTAMVVAAIKSSPRNQSRVSLASGAYPGLIGRARLFKITIFAILFAGFLFAIFTAFLSGYVSFGKTLLDRVSEVERQQQELSDTIAKVEDSYQKNEVGLIQDIATRLNIPQPVFRFCDLNTVLQEKMVLEMTANPTLFVPIYPKNKNPVDLFVGREQRALCGALESANMQMRNAYVDLEAYAKGFFFRYLCASCWTQSREVMRYVGFVPTDASHDISPEALKPIPATDGIGAKLAATVLSVAGNFVLPLLFTFLGAIAFVVRDTYNKARDNLLNPRDFVLLMVRLVLGVVVGVSIGLFLTPSATTLQAANSLTGPLTLSVAGLSFLAGYGVDGVFSMLDVLIGRVFALNDRGDPQARGSH